MKSLGGDGTIIGIRACSHGDCRVRMIQLKEKSNTMASSKDPKSVQQPKPKEDETTNAPALSSEQREEAMAKLAVMPSVQAGATIREYDREVFGALQSLNLAHGVQEKIGDVHEGNLNIVTDMLISQAHASSSSETTSRGRRWRRPSRC